MSTSVMTMNDEALTQWEVWLWLTQAAGQCGFAERSDDEQDFCNISVLVERMEIKEGPKLATGVCQD